MPKGGRGRGREASGFPLGALGATAYPIEPCTGPFVTKEVADGRTAKGGKKRCIIFSCRLRPKKSCYASHRRSVCRCDGGRMGCMLGKVALFEPFAPLEHRRFLHMQSANVGSKFPEHSPITLPAHLPVHAPEHPRQAPPQP